MSKATLNWARIHEQALQGFSLCMESVTSLSIAEQALATKREQADAETKADKKAMARYTANERALVSATKEQATSRCMAILAKYIDISDLLTGDIYHFNMEQFLRNIGVINGDGKLNNTAIKNICSIKAELVDRTSRSASKRRKGDNFITWGKVKDIKNDPIDLFLGFDYVMRMSGKIRLASTGYEVVQEQAEQATEQEQAEQEQATA